MKKFRFWPDYVFFFVLYAIVFEIVDKILAHFPGILYRYQLIVIVMGGLLYGLGVYIFNTYFRKDD